MKVSLVTKTMGITDFENRSIDEIVVAQARISSSKSKEEIFNSPEVLVRYMLLNGHFSPFEMCSLGFKIETSRAISLELIRHKSFYFQQYSQRYSESIGVEKIEIRKQSSSNRQSSSEIVEDSELSFIIESSIYESFSTYKRLLESGVAREVARFVLPEATTTNLYMNGSIRSWITFLNLRLHNTAQKEIREIAEKIRDILIEECPIISKALYNFENGYDVHFLDRVVLEKYGVYQYYLERSLKKQT